MSDIEYPDRYYRARHARIIENAQKTWRLNTPDHQAIENFLYGYFLADDYRVSDSFYGKLAASLFEKYGKLSEKQSDCVRKAIATRAERKAAYAKALEERKANSAHIGVEKERIIVTVTVDKILSVEVPKFSYYDSNIMLIYLMRDQDGNRVVLKTKSRLYLESDAIAEKSVITVKATVKAHADYEGEKQTIIQRAKVVSVDNVR